MTIKEIYEKIMEHQIEGIMFHEQSSKMLDFLGFKGLKMWQEYRYFSESAEMKSINRYVINHHSMMIREGEPKDPELIPMSWYGYKREEVDNRTKQSALKDLFSRLKAWETETKTLYCDMYKEACDGNYIADAVKIRELICGVDKELKHIDKRHLEYKTVDFDLSYIMEQQWYLKDKYKKKQKELFC
jgi:hypothetical protein